MHTDGKQIAAARQLFGWSQADLADRAGVSKPSIIRMEKDLNSVKYDVQSHVQRAMELSKIEFIDSGIRINEKIVSIIEGNDCYLKLLDEAFIALAPTKGEFLKSGANERRSSKAVINKLNEMRDAGITFRSLLKNKDTYMNGPHEEYRWMDDDLYVDSDVKVIFSNKVAYLMSWLSTYRIIVIEDEKIAEENKRTFNYIWKNSELVKV